MQAHKIDKVVHSAVGAGAIITAIIGLVLWLFNIVYLIVLVPPCLALAKEIRDKLSYGKFDWQDVKATLNPWMVMSWYLNQIKK